MAENLFDEARVIEAAEHIRKKLTAYIEADYGAILDDCPASKNGLTSGELELAVMRALGLLVLDRTQSMLRFRSEVEEDDG